jgi:hypothetical protein
MTATLRRRRWLTRALAAVAAGLVPWTLWLALSLPKNEVAHHYNVAWAGFDLALAAGIAATAWSAMHRTRWLVPLATATATMLLCDAWFDVVTSTPGDRLEAVLLAALAELPLAAVCAAIVVELRRG